jgi:hypothetical protein
MGLSFMYMLGLSLGVHIAHVAWYWKFFLFAQYTSPLSVQALQSRSCLSYVSYVTTAAYSLERSYDWLPLSLTWDPCYVASVRIHRKHSVSKVMPLLGVVTETSFPSSCLAMYISSGCTLPAFRRHVTVYCILKYIFTSIPKCVVIPYYTNT